MTIIATLIMLCAAFILWCALRMALWAALKAQGRAA